jgi:hypothetical protein
LIVKVSLIKELLNEQNGDGGWSLSSLKRAWKGSSLRSYLRSWVRQDGTMVESASDGYATGWFCPPYNRRARLAEMSSWSVGYLGSCLIKTKRKVYGLHIPATVYAVLALTEADHR